MNDSLWQTYCQTYEKCRKAKETGRHYINIQFTKDRGYRLIASKTAGRESCSLLEGFSSADWASNVMYRLASLGFVSAQDLDALFDELEKTGYKAATPPLEER